MLFFFFKPRMLGFENTAACCCGNRVCMSGPTSLKAKYTELNVGFCENRTNVRTFLKPCQWSISASHGF